MFAAMSTAECTILYAVKRQELSWWMGNRRKDSQFITWGSA